MAWISVGNSNEELCEKLVENGVIKSAEMFKAFSFTDRGDFVPQNYRAEAYFDRPFKRGFCHISAPHMYATVLEALELTSGLAFLNVGSGSGYLSCLAACLLGECGLSHGIDISADAVDHSVRCCTRWFSNILRRREEGSGDMPAISKEGVCFVHGNCFHIDLDAATACCRYDRIYIGAGCPEARKKFFFSLLSDDGIMVASINEKNELIKIRRRHRNIFTETRISQVLFAPLLNSEEEEDDGSSDDEVEEDEEMVVGFASYRRERGDTWGSTSSSGTTTAVTAATDLLSLTPMTSAASSPASYTLLSSLSAPLPYQPPSFASTAGGGGVGGAGGGPGGGGRGGRGARRESVRRVQRRAPRVRLPPVLWAPTAAVFTLLLASYHSPPIMITNEGPGADSHAGGGAVSGPVTVGGGSKCNCGTLPLHLWTFIITFASRDWFVPTPSELQLLREEVAVEKCLRYAAEANLEREIIARARAERERDVYKLMLRRMRYNAGIGAGTGAGLLNSTAIDVFNHLNDGDDDDAEEEEAENDDDDDEGDANDDSDSEDNGGRVAGMQEDEIVDNEVGEDDDDDEDELADDFTDDMSIDLADANDDTVDHSVAPVSSATNSSAASVMQSKSVNISDAYGDDTADELLVHSVQEISGNSTDAASVGEDLASTSSASAISNDFSVSTLSQSTFTRLSPAASTATSPCTTVASDSATPLSNQHPHSSELKPGDNDNDCDHDVNESGVCGAGDGGECGKGARTGRCVSAEDVAGEVDVEVPPLKRMLFPMADSDTTQEQFKINNINNNTNGNL